MASTVPAEGIPPDQHTKPTAVPPPPWLHLLAPPKGAVGSTVTICTSDGAVCHLTAEFASACTTISVMLEDTDAGDELPLTGVGVDELSHLVCAFCTATEHRPEVWGHLSTPQVATCLRASAFLGLEALRGSATSHLAERLRGLDVAAMRAACEVEASDFLTPAQQGLVVAMLSEPSMTGHAAVTASLAEPQGGGSVGTVLGLDWDSALLLLGTMDLHDLAPFLSSSRSACCLLFSPGFDDRTVFKAWAATLYARHPALSNLFSSIATAPGDTVTSQSAGDGAERFEEVAIRAVWSQQTEQMFSLWNVLRWFDDNDHTDSSGGATEDPAAKYAWLCSWVRDQSMHVCSAPTASCSRQRLRSVPLSLLFNCVYLLSTLKPPHNHAEELYALATEAVEAATNASGQRLSSVIPEIPVAEGDSLRTQPNPANAAAEPSIAALEASMNAEWTQLLSVHGQLTVAFGYLDQYHTARTAVPRLEMVCRESRDRCEAWQHAQSKGRWSGPEEATPPDPPQAEEPLLLIFGNESTLRVSVRQLEGCQSLLAQFAAHQTYAAQHVPEVAEPFLVMMGCSRVAMIKVIEFIEGIATAGETEEDKMAFIVAYKSSMEAQAQLGLLFQTMTAANMAGHRLLLDELSKMVAEMIASRTPAEIQEFFGIRKDVTWEEEVELMRQQKVRSSFICAMCKCVVVS